MKEEVGKLEPAVGGSCKLWATDRRPLCELLRLEPGKVLLIQGQAEFGLEAVSQVAEAKPGQEPHEEE